MKKKVSVRKHVRKTKKGFVPVRRHTKKIKKKNYGMGRVKPFVAEHTYGGFKRDDLLRHRKFGTRDEAERFLRGKPNPKIYSNEEWEKNYGADWTDDDFDWALRNVDNEELDPDERDKAFSILKSDPINTRFLSELKPHEFRATGPGLEPTSKKFQEFWGDKLPELEEQETLFEPKRTPMEPLPPPEETSKIQMEELKSELEEDDKEFQHIDFYQRGPNIIKGYKRRRPKIKEEKL